MKLISKKINSLYVITLSVCLYSQSSQAMLRRAVIAAEEASLTCLRRVAVGSRFLSSKASGEISELRKSHNPTGKFDHSHDRIAVEVDPFYDIAFVEKPFIRKGEGVVVSINKIPGVGVFGKIGQPSKKTLQLHGSR